MFIVHLRVKSFNYFFRSERNILSFDKISFRVETKTKLVKQFEASQYCYPGLLKENHKILTVKIFSPVS